MTGNISSGGEQGHARRGAQGRSRAGLLRPGSVSSQKLFAEYPRPYAAANSTFAGELDLTGAAIGGEIHLASGKREKSPVWQDGATLILRNVRANALQARQEDWSISGGDGLLPTELTGFTYSRLEGLDTSGGKGMGDETADWLIGWIEAQRDHGTNFDPQPYTQLAGILEATGATDKAKAIRYAKFEHKQDHDKSMNLFRRAFLLIEQIFVGFGVYPL